MKEVKEVVSEMILFIVLQKKVAACVLGSTLLGELCKICTRGHLSFRTFAFLIKGTCSNYCPFKINIEEEIGDFIYYCLQKSVLRN